MIRILQGDCREILRTLPDASVDSIVTDPPYELGFMGKKWDSSGIAYDGSVWRECLRVLKPGGHLLAFGGTRTVHRMVCAIEDAGFVIRDQVLWIYGSGFPKSLDVSKAIDKAAGAERPVAQDAWTQANRKKWQGWGTALKPAHEPICLARKPFAGNVAANVVAHGTGALNIDGCRIEVNDAAYAKNCSGDRGHEDNRTRDSEFAMGCGKAAAGGRWPANVIHDGSAEVVAMFPDDAGAQAPVTVRNGDKFRNSFGEFRGNRDEQGSTFQGDSGSAARFFYCAKADREDRNDGCEGMEERPLNWSSGTQSPGTFQAEGTRRASENNHPTVKPTDLMRYLCRLITPPGGTVLDPFAGSGSTGRAADIEGFDAILIEIDPRYVEIARRRIACGMPLFADVNVTTA